MYTIKRILKRVIAFFEAIDNEERSTVAKLFLAIVDFRNGQEIEDSVKVVCRDLEKQVDLLQEEVKKTSK